MNTEAPQSIDFPPPELVGENRTDPAVVLLNITPEQEYLECIEVKNV